MYVPDSDNVLGLASQVLEAVYPPLGIALPHLPEHHYYIIFSESYIKDERECRHYIVRFCITCS
jgi:hypothetical protein